MVKSLLPAGFNAAWWGMIVREPLKYAAPSRLPASPPPTGWTLKLVALPAAPIEPAFRFKFVRTAAWRR